MNVEYFSLAEGAQDADQTMMQHLAGGSRAHGHIRYATPRLNSKPHQFSAASAAATAVNNNNNNNNII